MGATADSGTALPSDVAGAAGAGTATIVAITGVCSSGTPRSTDTSTATAAMVGTTNTGNARTTGTASQEEDPNKTQASIRLPVPKANMSKEIRNNLLYDQRRLAAHIHAFLLQDSPDITQINDAEHNPVVGIINIPKSSMIRFLHSFGVGSKPIWGYPPIAGKIQSLVGDGSSDNPPQAMVLPREVFHKNSIQVPDQYAF